MSGFVSGINATGARKSIENYPGDSTMVLFIDKYCRENPLRNFNEGGAALVRDLRAK